MIVTILAIALGTNLQLIPLHWLQIVTGTVLLWFGWGWTFSQLNFFIMTKSAALEVPDVFIKLGTGILLCALGSFWLGEGLGFDWPFEDWVILGQNQCHRTSRLM
ncbi:MAG: hypothetical protein F6K30_05915 [Cyanothece sp. SIO2G6]|nr:hypothetical protein [Cyanothece sp. SIO2G6]